MRIRVKNNEGLGLFLAVCFGALLIAVVLALGGFCTEYVIEFWGSYLKGQPVDVSFGLCVLLSLFLGETPVPLAVLTWVIASMMA